MNLNRVAADFCHYVKKAGGQNSGKVVVKHIELPSTNPGVAQITAHSRGDYSITYIPRAYDGELQFDLPYKDIVKRVDDQNPLKSETHVIDSIKGKIMQIKEDLGKKWKSVTTFDYNPNTYEKADLGTEKIYQDGKLIDERSVSGDSTWMDMFI